MTTDTPVCPCRDVCVIPQGQPQPVASCRGLERQASPEALPVRRLYDALAAMMYGWEDDNVRLEAYAAIKEAADWLAKDRDDSRMTPTPELMARATQAVLSVIGVDDRIGARQAVVSPATQQMAADIARAVIEAIS